MEYSGLRTTIYAVDDIVKAKEWYAMIFRVRPYIEKKYYVGFNIGGHELGLIPEDELTKKGNSVVAYWGVDDIHKAYDNFLKIGATEIQKPWNVGGQIMVAIVEDLWGNPVGLVYNPEFRIRLKRRWRRLFEN